MRHIHLLIGVLLLLTLISPVLAEEEKSYLVIDSIPSGSDLYIAGTFYGYTPQKVEVPGGGTVSITLQRHGGDYAVWSGSVYVPKNQEVSYTAKMYRTSDRMPTVGYLIVNSNTEGAEVYLDNGYIGTITNGILEKDEIRIGIHRVYVTKDGYHPFEELIEFKEKNVATTTVMANLEPVAAETQIPTKTAPPAPTKSLFPLLSCLGLLGAGVLMRNEYLITKKR